MKLNFGSGADVESGLLPEGMCKLSWKNRLYGFGICFTIGCILTVLSGMFIMTANVLMFGILYSIGNLVAICSTAFLLGPMKQFKKMFDSTRIIATGIYLGTIVLTLLVALKMKNFVLVILCIVAQMLALLWYSLSYIPYARTAAKKLFKGLC